MIAWIGLIVVAQSKPVRDPILHREWVIAAAQGGGSGRLWLSPNGTFVEKFTEEGKTLAQTITGVYKKMKPPAIMPFMSPRTVEIALDMDLASAVRMGMPKPEIAKLKRSKTKTTPFQRLQFDPTIPILTDYLSVHFAPAGDSSAIQRFSERMRKLNPVAGG